MTLAHPVSGHPHVDIPLALTATAAALLVFVVAVAWPARQQGPAGPATTAPASWDGTLSPGRVAARAVSVALLVVAIVAGRAGLDDQLENLAPALVVGTAWPLLVLGSVCLGPVWRWVDPWDAVARVLVRDRAPQPPGGSRASAPASVLPASVLPASVLPASVLPASVWPAAAVALPVLWYVSVFPVPLDPRAVGLATAAYTIVTVSGCVAAGRGRWLRSWEPLGIVLSWLALVPRGRLAAWEPPRGAEALLGVFAGGVLFGAVRRSEVWVAVNQRPDALLLSTLGLLALCGALAGALTAAAAGAARVGARASVARALTPAVAGICLAVALERNRFFTSVQLLPGLLGDPFGRGWDLLGPSVDGLVPAPLGAVGLLVVQLGLLVPAHLLGAALMARRLVDRQARLPAALVLAHVVGGALVVVAMH